LTAELLVTRQTAWLGAELASYSYAKYLSDDQRKPDKVKDYEEDHIVVHIYFQETSVSAAKVSTISSSTFNLFCFYEYHS
jgi:hypothetical protein